MPFCCVGFFNIFCSNVAPNARQQLLDNLGYDPAAIAEAVRSLVDSAQDDAAPSENTTGGMSKATEDLVRKSLLVGNFEAAVECCFKSGQLADALILASCGGPELWGKAQQRYFETQSASKPFLSTVNAILHNQVSSTSIRCDSTIEVHLTLSVLACKYGSGIRHKILA